MTFLLPWLTCAAEFKWQSSRGYRSAHVELPSTNRIGFSRLAPAQTGIQFTNSLGEQRHLTNQILLNGSGVAAGDVDGDGWCDLYFCGLDAPNALYRNLGNWKFEEIAQSAGVACPDLTSTGAALADLDGDGDLDLVVNSVGGGTRLFANDGKARFRQIAEVNHGKGGMSLALADIDGDGFLDLYITNYRTSALMDMPNARAWFKMHEGKMVVERINGRLTTEPDLTNRFVVNARGGVDELGEPDLLLRNRGGTNFTPVSFSSGAFIDEQGRPLTATLFDWGLAAMFRDLNADGRPDLYVCNDFDSPDRIWLNLGEGKFQALPALALRKSSQFSMGIDFADINRDGVDDFFVLDMLSRSHTERMVQLQSPPVGDPDIAEARPQYGLNTLFLGRGDGTYAEIAQLSGLEASEWSWTPVFLDVDLDGWEDLLISNGQERAARDLDVVEELRKKRAAKRMSDAEIFQARKMFPRLDTPNLVFRNRGDLTFEEVSEQWGFADRGVSHGMALADLDNDGDLDVAVNNFHALPGIYRNETTAPRLAVRLRGAGANTRGIGAKITVRGAGLPVQSQEMMCGGRYLSSDDPVRSFAAGSFTNALSVEVRWRSGQVTLLNDVPANHLFEIEEAPAAPVGSNSAKATHPDSGAQGAAGPPATQEHEPLFEDVSERLRHVHVDEPFDDFARQRLLPNRLSQLGPGLAWCDVEGDGWEDLIVGSGKGGQLAVFQNDRRGQFNRLQQPPFNQPVTRDQTGILAWRSEMGTMLLAGSANYEDGLQLGGAVRRYDVGRGLVEDAVPGGGASTGPLAASDIDGDGDLDLLVGGRVIAGRYPEPASSRLFRYEGGKFVADSATDHLFEKLGLVSSAAFADLNDDGFAELVLACEWGPLRIFKNDRGRLVPWNPDLKWPATGAPSERASVLEELTGWWNGVAAGDFDGDGRIDLVASNWGRNTKYERHRSHPLRLYFGDLNADGTVQMVESHFDQALQLWVPERQLGIMAQALPFLRASFPTHRRFGSASVEQILAGGMAGARKLEAIWLESTVFLNRGTHFDVRPLPVEAQLATAFGISVADFNGDGREDLFLSQNFFATTLETPRYDAGRGLLLAGDGRGGFDAVSGQSSGLTVYGEQRGCASADFDRDGRVDLVVAQNRGATKLYRNRAGKAGLRVTLSGPAGNPNAVGATLRLVFARGPGPARQVGAGSGYWSQESFTQTFGTPEPAIGLRVRWPGGKESNVGLPAGSRGVRVDVNGGVSQEH